MIDLLTGGYIIIQVVAEVLKIAFYCAGLWLCLKCIDELNSKD